MLPEYSCKVPAILLTTKVPMVIILCISIIAIKGIRNILNMVVFFLL